MTLSAGLGELSGEGDSLDLDFLFAHLKDDTAIALVHTWVCEFAFNYLRKSYQGELSDEDVEDIAHTVGEGFLGVLASWEYRGKPGLRKWVCTAARHDALDLLRARGRARSIPRNPLALTEAGTTSRLAGDRAPRRVADVEDVVILKLAIKEALDQLGPPDRAIVAAYVALGPAEAINFVMRARGSDSRDCARQAVSRARRKFDGLLQRAGGPSLAHGSRHNNGLRSQP